MIEGFTFYPNLRSAQQILGPLGLNPVLRNVLSNSFLLGFSPALRWP